MVKDDPTQGSGAVDCNKQIVNAYFVSIETRLGLSVHIPRQPTLVYRINAFAIAGPNPDPGIAKMKIRAFP